MAVANIDLTDVRARDSGLTRNCANEITRTNAIALTDAHEQSRESCLRARSRTFTFPLSGTALGPLGRAFDWTLGFHALRRAGFTSLTLDDANSGSGDLETVKLSEQRLERYDLARRESRLKLVANRRAESLIARARLGGDL